MSDNPITYRKHSIKRKFPIRPAGWVVTLLCVLAILASCANPGSGPDGGRYDEEPPQILSMFPALGERNVKTKKVAIGFDEFIKVENASEKVVISPPQIEMPDIKMAGKKVTVTLHDTLKENTTYTIDFSDAIVDNNEGNPLGQFTYFFSTGENLDTMEVAGTVLMAENLEPVKGILVGLHSDTTDTAFCKKPFDRVARTDSRGRFTIKGVKNGSYRVFALKDMDGDFQLSGGEMAAAYPHIIHTSSYPDVRQDTVWRDSIYYDSIRTVHYTHYTPDNLILRAFQPVNTQRHYLKAERSVPEFFRIYFTAPSAHRPVIKGLNFDAKSLLLEQPSAGNDTITYWLRNVDFPAVDSLEFEYTYEQWDDSLQRNVLTTETYELRPKLTTEKRRKLQEEQRKEWEKKREKRHKRGNFSDETPPREVLTINVKGGQRMPLLQNPSVTFKEPLLSMDTAKIHLRLKKDSTEIEVPWEMEYAEGSSDSVLQSFYVLGEWRFGQQYSLVIDSAAVKGLYGAVNNLSRTTFSYGKEDAFGALFLNMPDTDTTMVVQLLANDTKVVRQVRVKGGKAEFFYLPPLTYYVRAFKDRNGNNRWDTGDYPAGLEPEEVYYYPGNFAIRANWDVEQFWRPDGRPLDQQKPKEITKQKADAAKTPKNRNAEREKNKRK